ncbi:MAG: GUN4 domain-containing protein [Elainella sp. C42_A2020_010]|nr:GUN4 domain-containing protein [Elainella sp. C42_A2020_010]
MKRRKVFTSTILLVAFLVALHREFGPVEYSRLEMLLAIGQWQAADRETEQIILKVSGRKWTGSIAGLLGWENSLKHFPCKDLQTIDQLWLKYSDHHFGLSVQQQIFQSFDVNDFNGDWFGVWKAFHERVGWRYMFQSKGKPEFDLNAPRGHLPSPHWALAAGGTEKAAPWMDNSLYLFQRVEACGLSSSPE